MSMSRYTVLAAMTVLALIGILLGLAQAEPTKFVFPNQGTSYEIDASGKTAEWAAQQLAAQTGVPSEYFLLYRENSQMFDGVLTANSQRYSNLLYRTDTLGSEDVINVFVRPVVGDHVHSLYSIWIHDGTEYRLVRPLFDDELEHKIQAADGETEYYFFKLHNGLHTHGKGLMHVHPWTSPMWFHETDGLGATLGNWLDDVNVTIRQPPYRPVLSLEFSNGIYFISKAEFEEIITNRDPSKTTKSYGEDFGKNRLANENGNNWKVLYWKHYLDLEQNKAPEVITDEIANLWLGRNLGVTILVYGPEADVVKSASDFATTVTHTTLREDITAVTKAKLAEMKESKLYLTLRQFDGRRYPSPQADDNRYQTEDKKYPLRDKEL